MMIVYLVIFCSGVIQLMNSSTLQLYVDQLRFRRKRWWHAATLAPCVSRYDPCTIFFQRSAHANFIETNAVLTYQYNLPIGTLGLVHCVRVPQFRNIFNLYRFD